jgi:hypothetical protein
MGRRNTAGEGGNGFAWFVAILAALAVAYILYQTGKS